MKPKSNTEIAPEVTAIGKVHSALAGLEPEAQARVLNYVAQMLKVVLAVCEERRIERTLEQREEKGSEQLAGLGSSSESQDQTGSAEDEVEGISPVAKKWMARNGLHATQLSAIFSLGVDEIDLIAKNVPGSSKRERMRSVFLLKGLAAYIGTGAARFTHEQAKQVCLDYNAFDATNFAAYLKTLASEVAGNKSSGYSLTARGLSNATDIVKSMTQKG